MVRSMTSYAREQMEAEWGVAWWEIRSVNHRYLDATVRLPEEWRVLETTVRERLGHRLKRGKVECSLRVHAIPGHENEFSLDLDLAKRLVTAAAKIETVTSGVNGSPAAPLGVSDILRWPGVIEPHTVDTEALGKALLVGLDNTLDEFVAGREREGAKLSQLLLGRCDEILSILSTVKPLLPDIIVGQRRRIAERLQQIEAEYDRGRLEQELVLFAQKIDIVEELERLESHVVEVRRILGSKEPVGRRLDFLMQELNREANTLGSKSVNTGTTKAAIDLKVLIEQMREQIQNLE